MDEKFLSVNEGYNLWAEVYDTDGNPLVHLEEPIVDKALGDVKGLAIVDLGCGTGRQTLRLAARGARMTGVDQSEGMLAKATAKPGADAVKFLHADLEGKKFPLPDAAFDRVVSFLVLEHITNLEHFFRESRRLCKPDGFLYFTAMHPAMLLKGVQARFNDTKTGGKVYPKGHPHQTSDFVNAAVAAGLTLTAMSEHAPREADAAERERGKRYVGWPLLLTLKFTP